MPPIEHFFFPAIVLLAIILVVLSAKLVFRLMLVFVAVFVIWYGLFLLGLAPSPINYFNTSSPKEQNIHAHVQFHLDRCMSIRLGEELRFSQR
jgi:hypothetical protein